MERFIGLYVFWFLVVCCWSFKLVIFRIEDVFVKLIYVSVIVIFGLEYFFGNRVRYLFFNEERRFGIVKRIRRFLLRYISCLFFKKKKKKVFRF